MSSDGNETRGGGAPNPSSISSKLNPQVGEFKFQFAAPYFRPGVAAAATTDNNATLSQAPHPTSPNTTAAASPHPSAPRQQHSAIRRAIPPAAAEAATAAQADKEHQAQIEQIQAEMTRYRLIYDAQAQELQRSHTEHERTIAKRAAQQVQVVHEAQLQALDQRLHAAEGAVAAAEEARATAEARAAAAEVRAAAAEEARATAEAKAAAAEEARAAAEEARAAAEEARAAAEAKAAAAEEARAAAEEARAAAEAKAAEETKAAAEAKAAAIGRVTDVEPRRDLGPIRGVMAMPLVTLEEAIRPLIGIVPLIDAFADDAKKFSSSRPIPQGLDLQQAAAVHLYTTEAVERKNSLYYIMNQRLSLVDRELIKPFFSYMRLLLGALAVMPKWSPREPLWRGVNGDLRADYPRDAEFTWWRFSSTTTDMEQTKAFLGGGEEKTLFWIAGVDTGVDIRGFSAFPKEAEVLLPAGTMLQVMEQMSHEGLHIVRLQAVKPKFPPVM